MNPFEASLNAYFSLAQLQRIRSCSVGIAGAGGLGSNIALCLARCGYRHITLMDFDTIEPSNLNRQQYFLEEIGQNKVAVLKDRILRINPEAHITALAQRWSEEKTEEDLFENCSVLVEAFDRAGTKKSFVQHYQPGGKWIISASGLAGLTTDNPLRIQRLKNIFIVGDQKKAVSPSHPALAPQVTLCAAKMAEIVLNLTLDPSFAKQFDH